MKKLIAMLTIAILTIAPAVAEEAVRIVAPYIDPAVYNPNIDAENRSYIDPESEIDEDAPLDDLPHVTANKKDLEDFNFQYDTVYAALPLIDILVNVVDRNTEFTGPPGSLAAWQAIYRFLITQSTTDGSRYDYGLRDGRIAAQNVTAVYDALFAYGRIPEQMEEVVSWIARDGEAYVLDAVEMDSWRTAYINGVTAGTANDLIVDISVLTEDGKNRQVFTYNAQVTLLPDSNALYGVKIAGISVRDVRPRFTSAEAMYGMGETHDDENGAMNVLDNDSDTFWLFDPGQNASVTVNTTGTQTVRGLCMLPFDARGEEAMRAYGRIKSLRVTLSDGNIFEKTFDDFTSLGQWVCVPFEGVHPVNWVRIEVMDVYPGDAYRQACLSDLYFY